MSRPYVICHMLTSLDAKISGEFMAASASAMSIAEYGRLRGFSNCSATLYGTTTMAESYAEGFVGELPHSSARYFQRDYIASSDTENYIVSVDPEGVLGWKSKYIEKKNRPKAHVIEVLTERVSNDYLAYLHSFDISYIFAGQERLDCRLLLRKLKDQFGIDRLMLAGGGRMNGSFLQEHLIDELSLVLAPVAESNQSEVGLFEREEALPKGTLEKHSIYVVELKERTGLKVKTLVRYKDMLKRINAEIGPVKLAELRPDHLNRLYAKLAEPGQNKRTGEGLSAKTRLIPKLCK